MWHQEGAELHSLDSSPSKDSAPASAATCSPPPASQGASMMMDIVPEEQSPRYASERLHASNWPQPSLQTALGSARRSVSKWNPLAEAEVAPDPAHPKWNVSSGALAVEEALEQVAKTWRAERHATLARASKRCTLSASTRASAESCSACSALTFVRPRCG